MGIAVHCCAWAYLNLVCKSVALAICCSGHASSQYLTSMRCTSQREECIASLSLWWPFFIPNGSMQIASGLERDRSLSADRFGRRHWGKVLVASCAGKTRLGWVVHVSLWMSAKIMFPPRSPLLKVLMMRLEAILCPQSPYFKLKHSDNQKAYGFGCLADDTTDKMNECH